jgi:hypothetical protein
VEFVVRPPPDIPAALADLARCEADWLRFRPGRKLPLLALLHSDPRRWSFAEPERTPDPRLTHLDDRELAEAQDLVE